MCLTSNNSSRRTLKLEIKRSFQLYNGGGKSLKRLWIIVSEKQEKQNRVKFYHYIKLSLLHKMLIVSLLVVVVVVVVAMISRHEKKKIY